MKLELLAGAADVANEDFGADAGKTAGKQGHTVISFSCGNPDFALSRVLAAKGAIRVLEGTKLRKLIEAELAAIKERYAR